MGNYKVEFNINDVLKYPIEAEECSAVYDLTQPVEEEWDSWECEQEEDNNGSNFT